MRRTKEDAELTRKQLLEAALKVFSEKGYAITRLSDIAEAAGVTRGAIYWHFGNKKELLIELMKGQVDPFFEILSQVLNEDLSPLKKIEKTIRVLLEKFEKDKTFLANQHLNLIEVKIRREIPEVREYMRRRGENFSLLMQKLVEKGIAQGEIRKIDAKSVATTFATMIAGYSMLVMDADAPFDINIECFIDILLNGIKA
ncbi:TetR family transcriptional regulator [candidate division KSB1 bacterium]|nr:TetR family transcriptional regulator [candidate division KSB1 bacterium]